MATSRQPPRYVPTLTDVVQVSGRPAPGAGSEAGATAAPMDSQALQALQEQVIHRVMQRVDLSLERRLREAVATLVLEQTRNLGPLLRDEIEAVVRKSVSDAVAQELAARN